MQNNTLSRADLNYDQGNIKNVHYGDVLIKFGEYIDVASAELPYINDNSIESKFAKSLLEDGDIIIADTAEDETVGKCCEITNSEGMKLLSGLHTIAVRPQQKYASKFLGYYLNSNAYHSQLLPLMQGIKVTSISKGALQDTVLTVPTSIDEQRKIGECLSNIDDAITLHQCMHYPHQICRRRYESISFYRHNTTAWEQRKFGDVTEIRSASRVHREEWTSSGVPFYRSSDVMAALNGTENEKAFISIELYEKLSAVSGKLAKGDVLVTGGGSVGNPYIVPNDEPLYTKDADLLWIKNNGSMDPMFVYEFFLSPVFRAYLGSVSHVGTIAHYTITQLSDTPISLPSIEEQRKIGETFKLIDNAITLHQRNNSQ